MQYRKLITSKNPNIKKKNVVLSCHQGVSKPFFTFESLRDLLKITKSRSYPRANKLQSLGLGQRHHSLYIWSPPGDSNVHINVETTTLTHNIPVYHLVSLLLNII